MSVCVHEAYIVTAWKLYFATDFSMLESYQKFCGFTERRDSKCLVYYKEIFTWNECLNEIAGWSVVDGIMEAEQSFVKLFCIQ